MPGIRESAPDCRPSRLLVQEAPVLLILCILCIDVQSVESRFNGTWHLFVIANMDPLFHSRMIRTAGRGRCLSETNAGEPQKPKKEIHEGPPSVTILPHRQGRG